MKSMTKWTALLLALMLLATACGREQEPAVEDNGPSVNYEDYVKPVTDRKVAECITADEVSAAVGVPMSVAGSVSDDTVNYQSADALYMVTVAMEFSTYEQIEAVAVDPTAGWTRQENVAEVAFWSEDSSELIAYYEGYGISVYFSRPNRSAMLAVLRAVLEDLDQ
ncbi:MAG: hypothetical protein IJN04_07245 [Clostridia bacterium]|nr:hypothetical protein [Clostridia bacterium]